MRACRAFQEQLQYNTTTGVSGISPKAQFNGNIASQSWGTTASPNTSSYLYRYDQINRLSSGILADNSYGERGISYDLRGNISTLSRVMNSVITDSLVFTYPSNSNMLTSILDKSTDSGTATVKTGTSTYSFNGNGNMVTDNNKGLTSITYNLLNLPQSFGSKSTGYTYDANGQKLRKVISSANTDYVNGIQYDGTSPTTETISFIQTEEGRAIPNGSAAYTYDYYLLDHLGDARVAFDAHTKTASLIQQDNYLPFGFDVPTGTIANPQNLYLYNKKELQEETGYYDYGSRFMDPVIGRFTTIDPMAEMSRRFSTYTYGDDNPIRNIDPDGMATEDAQGIHSDSPEEAQAMFRTLQAQQQQPPKKKKQSAYDLLSRFTDVKNGPKINKLTSWWSRAWASFEDGRDYNGITYDNDGNPEHIAYMKMEINPPFGPMGELSALSQLSVETKLATYLLNFDHVAGASKAKFFEQVLGFTKANSAGLAKQIVFDAGKAVQTGVTQYGTTYNQVISIVGANGRTVEVLTGWIKNNDNVVRLVTAFPAK